MWILVFGEYTSGCLGLGIRRIALSHNVMVIKLVVTYELASAVSRFSIYISEHLYGNITFLTVLVALFLVSFAPC